MSQPRRRVMVSLRLHQRLVEEATYRYRSYVERGGQAIPNRVVETAQRFGRLPLPELLDQLLDESQAKRARSNAKRQSHGEPASCVCSQTPSEPTPEKRSDSERGVTTPPPRIASEVAA